MNCETVDEPGGPYLQLLASARAAATTIIATQAAGLTGAAEYIYRVSRELVTVVPDVLRHDELPQIAVCECLDRLVDAWPRVADGSLQGEQVLSAEPLLWKRAMTEWPMGDYAGMAARFLIVNDLASGNVLELGAGVGSCGALLAEHVGDGYIRSDLRPFLLTRQPVAGAVSRYDFNEPGRWRDLDAVFAVNALHCAKDKAATLGYIHEMLRPGGVVVLGEGVPYTDAHGTPWALNSFFGLFRGWWDVGGFLTREQWVAAFTKAGFRNCGWTARRAGAHDLGGIVWAER